MSGRENKNRIYYEDSRYGSREYSSTEKIFREDEIRRRKNGYYKKRKKRRQKLFISVLIIILVAVGVFFGVRAIKGKTSDGQYYLASNDAQVKLFTYDEYGYLVSNDTAQRGTAVTSSGKTIENNGVTYTQIQYDGGTYYVVGDFLSKDFNDIVREKTKYVRTAVTVYEDNETPLIESWLKKGSELEVLGYDELLEDGSVNMYNIKSGDVTGWVYGKYLTNTYETATAVYNENGEDSIHKTRIYDGLDLGGGDPANLDWYPYEKPNFESNPVKQNARAMYLTIEGVSKIDDYITLAKSCGCDTFVIDIKDDALAYDSEVAAEVTPTSVKTAYFKKADYQAQVKKAKDAGIYIVGRIVAFKDTLFAKDHPESAIESSAASSTWPSAYSREAWEYNIRLALEAVELCGFNEIQFDYVRFPEESYKMSQVADTDFKNTYGEGKCEAIQNFAFYAADQLHKAEVYVSFDVFGECAGEYVTAYGQYWPAISNVIDAISGMPYTDHFGTATDTWSDPYTTMYDWGVKAAKRQSEIPTPAIARTWLTCYNTPWWSPTVIYDASKMEDQVKGLIDAGLPGGFMTWNGKANLDKYTEVKAFWGYDYDWYKVADDK